MPHTTVRAGFQIDRSTKEHIHQIIVARGYGLKGKQAWYRSVLESFLDPDTWRVDQADSPCDYQPWLRVIVDTTYMRSRDRVNEYMTLTREQWARVWWTALRAAEYGGSMEDPVYLELAVRHVLQAAVIWGVQHAGVYRVDTSVDVLSALKDGDSRPGTGVHAGTGRWVPASQPTAA